MEVHKKIIIGLMLVILASSEALSQVRPGYATAGRGRCNVQTFSWDESDKGVVYEIPSEPRHSHASGNYIYTKERRSSEKRHARVAVQHDRTKSVHSSAGRKSSIIYTVKKGDTLYSISRRFGISVSVLKKANSIKNSKNLQPGTRLQIQGERKISRTSSHKKKITSNQSSSGRSSVSKTGAGAPNFSWPLRKVLGYKADGDRDVRSIGLLIKSRPGVPVYTAAAGVVKKVGQMRGYGRYIVVTHSHRYITVYAHLGKIQVREGQKVNSRDVIGNVDRDNNTLHFQIDHAGKPVNPLQHLPGRKS